MFFQSDDKETYRKDLENENENGMGWNERKKKI